MTTTAPSPARLGDADSASLGALLDAEPILNVYLRSELRLMGVGALPWWGVRQGEQLTAALLGGSLAVPWMPQPADAGALAEALSHQLAPRMIVGPREQVHALQAARTRVLRPREVRDPQRVLVLPRGGLRVQAEPVVVPGAPQHLDRLTLAAAAMHREEMGVDPLSIDPAAWRQRMTTLIDRGWSWAWIDATTGEVVFKTELSAWTPEVAQIQGVWTAPAWRGRGVATRALAAVCQEVLRWVPVCTLYANGYNAAALSLYERLGFRHVGDYATLMF